MLEPILLSQAEDGSLPTLTAPEPETAPETDAPSETPSVTPSVTPSDAPAAPPATSSETVEDETTTPSEILEPEIVPPANASELDLEFQIDAIPDSLLADPNPLTFPTTTEEVMIEQNPTITIEQAIELAYRNNQSLQAALLSQEQAAAAVREARAALRPNVDIGSNITTQESTRPTDVPGLGAVGEPSGADTTISGAVEVNYNLLTGGLAVPASGPQSYKSRSARSRWKFSKSKFDSTLPTPITTCKMQVSRFGLISPF